MSGTDAEIAIFAGDYADATGVLLQAQIRAHVKVGNAFAAGDAFLGAYDDGTNTYLVTVEAGSAEDGSSTAHLLSTAEVVVIGQLSGVSDATALVDANFIANVAS